MYFSPEGKLEEIQTLRLLLKSLEEHTKDWGQWSTSVGYVGLRIEFVMWKRQGCHLGKLISKSEMMWTLKREWIYTLLISFNPIFSVIPTCLGLYFIISFLLNYKWLTQKLLQESVLSTFIISQGIRKVSRLPLGTKEAVGVNCDVEMYPFKSNKHLYFLNFKWNKWEIILVLFQQPNCFANHLLLCEYWFFHGFLWISSFKSFIYLFF